MKRALLALLFLMTPLLAQHPLVQKADMACFRGDSKEALKLYFAAAKEGDADAAFKSGFLLSIAASSPKNKKVSKFLLEDAISRLTYAENNGHIQAAMVLDFLLNRERSEASKLWMLEESICDDYRFYYKGYYDIVERRFVGEITKISRRDLEETRKMSARYKKRIGQ